MGFYLYGIVKLHRVPDPGPIGIGDPPAGIIFLAEGQLAAVASRMDLEQRLSLVRDGRAHQGVLDSVLKSQAVLPISFGTIASSEGAVRNLLRNRSAEFLQTLTELDGKVEVGVKALWEKAAVMKELASRWGDLQSLERRVREHPQQANELSVGVGRAVAELLEQWENTHIARVKRILEARALDSRYNEPISIRMLMNAAYLVARNEVAAFEDLVRKLDRELEGRIRFHFAAPLPAHNFVDIRITPEEVEQLVGK